jgi:hypothetical protein
MNFHENSRTSRAATKNLARSEFHFTGGSIVLDDIGEKPSSLVESHEVARPSANFPINFLVSPGSAVTGPFCPERNGEFPPRGSAAPASSLPSRRHPWLARGEQHWSVVLTWFAHASDYGTGSRSGVTLLATPWRRTRHGRHRGRAFQKATTNLPLAGQIGGIAWRAGRATPYRLAGIGLAEEAQPAQER